MLRYAIAFSLVCTSGAAASQRQCLFERIITDTGMINLNLPIAITEKSSILRAAAPNGFIYSGERRPAVDGKDYIIIPISTERITAATDTQRHAGYCGKLQG